VLSSLFKKKQLLLFGNSVLRRKVLSAEFSVLREEKKREAMCWVTQHPALRTQY